MKRSLRFINDRPDKKAGGGEPEAGKASGKLAELNQAIEAMGNSLNELKKEIERRRRPENPTKRKEQ